MKKKRSSGSSIKLKNKSKLSTKTSVLPQINLRELIRHSFAKGVGKEEIRNDLVKLGWSKKNVDSSLYDEDAYSGVIIQLKDVSMVFGDNQVLNGVNMDIKRGDLFGIIGLSGSGKTTLLNTIIGFVKPVKGKVSYRLFKSESFKSVLNNADDVKKAFGFSAQDPSFYNKLTAKENLMHFASLYDIDDIEAEKRSIELLKLVGLSKSENTLSQNLSGGMQKRLDIACSLVHNPKILVLDEPTADLDPVLRAEMWSLIKQVNKKGTTVILASHFLQEMEKLCSRIGILHKGAIMRSGTPAHLKSSYTRNEEVAVETVSGEYKSLIKKIGKNKSLVKKYFVKGHRLIIYSGNAEALIRKIIHIVDKSKDKVLGININKPPLREIFESLIRSKK